MTRNSSTSRAGALGIAFAATGLLTLGFGVTGAAAAPLDVTSGHVDVVEVECVWNDGDPFLEIGTHIDGVGHVEPGDVGDVTFRYDRVGSAITYGGTPAGYTVPNDAAIETTLPYVGFAYEAEECLDEEPELELAPVRVSVSGGSGDTGAVSISTSGSGTASTAGGFVTLDPETHVHAQWFFASASAGDAAYTLTFTVEQYNGDLDTWLPLGTITPAGFVLEDLS